MTKVRIETRYFEYTPPVRVNESVQLLMRYVPEEHLNGLHTITLTNSESLKGIRGKITSEKRRFRPAECLGLYGDGHIFVAIDQIFSQYPELLLLVPPLKTVVIGQVLYHEIGHHIHRLEEPGYRPDRETEADEWRDKLMQLFVRKRYWYLRGTADLARVLIRPIAAKLKKDRSTKEDE